MKKIFTACFLISFYFSPEAQVFNGTGGAILDNGQDTYFALNVTGLPAQIDSTYGLETVCFNINHPADNELYIYLQSPTGILVELTLGSSSSGSDFVSSCYDSHSSSSSTLGSAPYTGTFKPVGYLGRFNTAQAGNGNWTLVVHDGFPGTNAGTLVSWSLQFGANPSHPVVFKSSNLPIVVINASQPISDASTTVNMGIIDNGAGRNYITDPLNGYNAKASMQWHGSSTKNFEKKAYGIETRDMSNVKQTASLLGMPAESDWVLGASYIDKTLMRIPLAYDMFRRMGHYAARFQYVELMLNNEYRGVYALTEKIKRDSNRVHVQVMSTAANSWPSVSGGYVFKIDRTDAPGWYSLLPGDCQAGTHFYFNYVYPNSSNITPAQQNYIKSYVDSFETVMASPNFADPLTGYSKYISTQSFIDVFIINELSKEVDAYRLSTYLYKKNISHGGKMYIGPVWDYDNAWHNTNYGNTFNSSGWQYQSQACDYPTPTWWSKFMQDPNFLDALRCRWNELRQTILDVNYLNNYIDSSANRLSEAQQRNFTQYPILGAFIYPNPQSQAGATYATEIADLKTWVANRIAWLDANMPGTCQVAVATINSLDKFSVYPNPMESSVTFALQLEQNADVSLCITDVLGKEVARFLNANTLRGTSKISFERNQLKAGIYFYQLQVNNSVRTGKLVMQ